MNADRPFSFRQDLADQWYDLNNPLDTSTETVTVQFDIDRAYFPPNILDGSLNISHLVLFFSSGNGEAIEVNDVKLGFTRAGEEEAVTAKASTVNGVISTRQGANAAKFQKMINNSPLGKWELTLPMQTIEQIKKEEITDILFVISYHGQTPAWPN